MIPENNEPKRNSRPLPDLAEPPKLPSPPKKVKRRKSNSRPIGISYEVEGIKSDVFVVKTNTESVPTLPQSTVNSQPSKFMYLQNKDKFKSIDREKPKKEKKIESPKNIFDGQNQTSAISSAISLQSYFQTFALFLQGVLAGLATWQLVTIYSYGLGTEEKLITSTRASAKYVSIVYYVCLAVSVVSLMDRINFSNYRKYFMREFLLPTTPALILSIIALIANLANFAGDICISSYIGPTNSTSHNIFKPDVKNCGVFSKWRRTNMVRCISAILVWVFAVLCRNFDSLKTRLTNISENI